MWCHAAAQLLGHPAAGGAGACGRRSSLLRLLPAAQPLPPGRCRLNHAHASCRSCLASRHSRSPRVQQMQRAARSSVRSQALAKRAAGQHRTPWPVAATYCGCRLLVPVPVLVSSLLQPLSQIVATADAA